MYVAWFLAIVRRCISGQRAMQNPWKPAAIRPNLFLTRRFCNHQTRYKIPKLANNSAHQAGGPQQHEQNRQQLELAQGSRNKSTNSADDSWVRAKYTWFVESLFAFIMALLASGGLIWKRRHSIVWQLMCEFTAIGGDSASAPALMANVVVLLLYEVHTAELFCEIWKIWGSCCSILKKSFFSVSSLLKSSYGRTVEGGL